MTWGGVTTFLYGAAVIILDALLFKPIYRHVHRRSKDMTTTDLRRLQEAELTIAQQAATIRRLEAENASLLAQADTKETTK